MITKCSGKPWRSNNTADVEAHERSIAFHIGLYSEPIYNTGDWPEVVKQTLNESVLPRFTDQQKADLKGKAPQLLDVHLADSDPYQVRQTSLRSMLTAAVGSPNLLMDWLTASQIQEM